MLQPIPHNLLRALDNPRFSPSLYQLFTLSTLTGYQVVDWLSVFGFSLEEIVSFQTLFPSIRTVELDARIYGGSCRMTTWFDELRLPDFAAPLTPLTGWLGLTGRRNFQFVSVHGRSAHRFVKIGTHDCFAFPDLLPGSIVRIRLRPENRGNLTVREFRTGLFLVEHSQGIVCTRLGQASNGKLVLCSRQLPYAPVELEQGTEAVVRGKVDMELRQFGGAESPVVPSRLGRFWTPHVLSGRPPRYVGEFIRNARLNSGLSFREGSQRTLQIARILGDSRYYCAQGTLSDFETRKRLPRQIHKIISLCAVYFTSFARLIAVAGLSLEKAGSRRIPGELLKLPSTANFLTKPSAFFQAVERRFGTAPYFLGRSLGELLHLPDLSARSVFWAGTLEAHESTGLRGALFLAVDRRQKVPRPSLSSPAPRQPLYVVELRSGVYLCGFCTLQNGVLILRPCVRGHFKLLRLRNRVEAEVVGRVTAVLRRFPQSLP